MLVSQSIYTDYSDQDDNTRVVTATPQRVAAVLMPCADSDLNEPITVQQLPLWVGRDSNPFVQYRDQFPDQIRFLSRQHAYLYTQGEQIFVQDLGSSNGTELNGQRLEAQLAVLLCDGDHLRFGGDLFSYTLKLKRKANPSTTSNELTAVDGACDQVEKADKGNNTVSINSPELFLNMFCEAAQSAASNESDSADAAQAVSDAQASFMRRRIHKVKKFSSELKQALADGNPSKRRRNRWITAAATGLLIATATLAYWQNSTQWHIKELLQTNNYQQVLIETKDYLDRYPEDIEIAPLATEALIKVIVPAWSHNIGSAQFETARTLLSETATIVPNTTYAHQTLTLLSWISELQAYAHERSGMNQPLQLFGDEQRISSLLQQWDDNAHQHELAMIRISHHIPSFESTHAQVDSHLRTLRNEKAVYLNAIAEMRTSISKSMSQAKGNAALATLAQFEDKYPNLSGGETLRADIEQLIALQQAAQNKDLDQILRLYRTDYATPLMDTVATQWIAAEIPAANVLGRYQAASKAWRKGQVKIARTLLQSLTAQKWGEIARAKLAHVDHIQQSFTNLKARRQSSEYSDLLLAFYSALDAHEDSFFIDAISDDIQSYSQVALSDAQAAFQKAQAAWDDYLSNGRITNLMRLEKQVSKSFKQQRQRLLESYQHVVRATRMHSLIGGEYTDSEHKLYEAIVAECQRQRQWLNNLSLVLAPEVLAEKLASFPDPKE